MHIFNDPQVMRQVIMDHYEHPRNRGQLRLAGVRSIHMDTAGCIDDIDVYLSLENGIIKGLTFDGVACTISTASTSIMTELLIGKTKQEATYIVEQYIKMIHAQPYDASVLGEAMVFQNTHKQASRIKCATLGWQGLSQLLKEEK
jgi:nitrogen fixation protein NifU and related proteins